MSCWMVSKTHIDALVTAAVRLDVMPGIDALSPENSILTPSDLGRWLWLANAASVKARYPNGWQDMLPDGGEAALEAYSWRQVTFEPVTLLKAVHCLRYQSCDISVYAGTWQDRTTRRIEAAIIRTLPGYDAAPWGLDDPPAPAAAPSNVVPLMIEPEPLPYRVVRRIDGELRARDYRMHRADFVGEMEALGFEYTGDHKSKVTRPELQSQPQFAGLCGPMWDGNAIRYEDPEANAILSA